MHPGGHPVTRGFGAAILGCAGPRLTADEKRLFQRARPFGFIVFDRNLENPDQIRALTDEMRGAVGYDAPIFIDQEGGRVQRLRPPLARDWLPPLDEVQRLGRAAVLGMTLRYRLIAAELLSYGIDGNCAPTLDIARDQTHPVLRNRCYGRDVATVVAVGRAVVQAHLDMGVLPVIKHMPGHGLAQVDSHTGLPVIDAPRDELETQDFAVFRAFSDAPLGMTAHLVFTAYDTQPATVSTRMMSFIRQAIGFDGLLMTDDISMQALSGSVAERGQAALTAGCDCVLHCNGDLTEMLDLMERIGPMGTAAQERAKAALRRREQAREAASDIDIPALEAEFAALPRGPIDA